MNDSLSEPLVLRCGAVLRNRLCKAAMTEGVADAFLRATPAHERLYRTWSEGGAGLLLTGNLQVDRKDLERPANVAIDRAEPATCDAEARERLRRWARAGTQAGNHLWVQLAHAGRQAPRYVTQRPVAPSAVQLDLLGNYARPRALTEAEILDLIGRFAHAATVVRECGFTGVQVHGAHGYLISSFLSPVTNQRTDAWGGTLENRARFLLEAVRAVRRAVGRDFPVGVKLNSDDFRKGGFSHADCLQVVQWLNSESIDLLEISGGTYEQPRLLGFEGRAEDAVPVRPSTRAREAYFLDYAAAIRRVAAMPLMVTGGFRTRAGMESALGAPVAVSGTVQATVPGTVPVQASDERVEAMAERGDCDMIGLGRPLCWMPDFPRRLLNRELEGIDELGSRLVLREKGWLSPTSPYLAPKVLNAFAGQAWYYCQIFRLARGLPADLERGLWSAFFEYLREELRAAYRLHRAYAGRLRG